MTLIWLCGFLFLMCCCILFYKEILEKLGGGGAHSGQPWGPMEVSLGLEGRAGMWAAVSWELSDCPQ